MSDEKKYPAPAEGFQYWHKPGDFPKDFLERYLFPGHYHAWKCLYSAQKMFDAPMNDGTRSIMQSFFGKEWYQAPYYQQIKDRFEHLRKNLFQKYRYIGENCGYMFNSYCQTKPENSGQALTKQTGSRDIIMCYEVMQLYKYTVGGMAALILHENVHRLGFFTEDRVHVDNKRFMKLRDTGEVDFTKSPKYENKSTKDMLECCDSYACVATWAYEIGGYFKPIEENNTNHR